MREYGCGSGSIPARDHSWVEIVAGSRLAPRVFLWVLRVLSLNIYFIVLTFFLDRFPVDLVPGERLS